MSNDWNISVTVATPRLALRWICDSPQTECARRTTPIYKWRKHGMIEWSWHVISIVACCHSMKLCTHAAQAFRSRKMELWPGCEVGARCRLHKKNVPSVRFIVKRRGCCCNPSVGIALNVRFTTNGMCVKNNTHMIYKWYEQAIIEWSQHVMSIIACCHSAKFCTHATRLSDRNMSSKKSPKCLSEKKTGPQLLAKSSKGSMTLKRSGTTGLRLDPCVAIAGYLLQPRHTL